MKTTSITAALMISLAASAFADEKAGKDEIKVRAQYVMPQADQKELSGNGLFRIVFPVLTLDASDVNADPSKAAAFKFKNPEAITEEGLSEKAFHIALPAPVIGNPEELRIEKADVKFQFKNPKAITEEGLTEKAFRISYPAPVIGSPEDVNAGDLKFRQD